MNRIKRSVIIIAILLLTMLIIPIITINIVKADAGMLVTLLLFFAVYPVVSIIVGVLSGKDIKFFWFTPLLVAALFWAFSSLTHKTAFPVVYSAIYFVVCTVSMSVSFLINKNRN